MNQYFSRAAVSLAAILFLTGCDPSLSGGPNENTGKIFGGIAGAVIGSNISKDRKTGAVVGALAGSYIGGNIGKDIDKENQERIAWVLENKPSHTTVSWDDPDKRHFEVVPEPSFRRQTKVCRPFKLKIYDRDGTKVTRGVACRVEGKRWVVDGY